MRGRRFRWIHLFLLASLAANLVLLTGVLYLRVPAIHEALLPIWRAVRTLGIPSAQTSPTPTLTQPDSVTSVGPPRLLTEGELFLSLRDDKTSVTLFLPPINADQQYVIRLDGDRVAALELGGSSIVWELHDGGTRSDPNTAEIYVRASDGMDQLAGDIEMYRVSETEAREHLLTERENGWVFVGRCTFDLIGEDLDTFVIAEEIRVLSTLTSAERSRLCGFFPDVIYEGTAYTSSADLVHVLSELTAMMCSLGLRNVSASNNAAIYSESPSNAVLGVSEGRIGVQCQGLRSVFSWVAIAGGWLDVRDVREVDLYRYPLIEGIDVNSHAILEIRLPEGDWMVFDPLAQVVFTDSAGAFLSAADIRYLRSNGDLSEIAVLSVSEFCVSNIVPYYTDAEGGYWGWQDFSDQERANYNYWSVFERIVYRYLTLPLE